MICINSTAPNALIALRAVGGMTNPDFQARWLDRLADAELQHGHHARAEELAARAAEMRGRA